MIQHAQDVLQFLDTPRSTLVLSSSSIGENGGMATVTATLDRQSSIAVTVTVSAAAGTNAVAADFTLSTATTLTFAANATASTGLVTVTAVNNPVDSPNKSVTVSGTASDSLGLANDPPSVTLTLTDDDAAPGATLALDPASVTENAGVATVTATLSNPSSQPSTVTVAAVSGGYTVGADTTIVIAAGATTNVSDTVLVTAVDDQIHQGSANRSVTVTGALANGQGAGAVTGAALTLTDDETLPTVALVLSEPDASSPDAITENGGVSTVTATLTGPSNAAVTVTVGAAAVASTGAVAGDFALSTAATLTFAPGATMSTGLVTVTANDNDVDAADKQVTVSGTSAGGNGVADPSAVTLTLENDDDATATLVLTPPVILENGEVSTVTAVLSNPATEAATLTVSTAAGANTAAGDFTAVGSTLTIAAGATTSTGVVTIMSVDNSVASGRKRVTVAATAMGGRGVAAPSSVTLVIRDDEYGIDESAVTGQATEGGGTATFTVALQTQPSAAVTVSAASGDASEGRVAPSTLVFTTGNWETARTVTVTGVDDDVDDGDAAWQVRLTSSSGDSNYHGLAVDVDVTTEDDDGPPGVTLALDPASIPEAGGVSAVTARLSHPSSAATTLTVTATPVAPATAGDYTLSMDKMLTIAAGSTRSTGVVTITADDAAVASADKTVTVSAAVDNDRTDMDSTTMAVTGATLTIADDDRRGFAFDPAETVPATAGAAATYTAALTSEPDGTVTVSITPAGDAGLTVSPSRLTFTPSDWSDAQTVMVTAQPDGDDLADVESLTHAASGGGYGGVTGTLAVAVSEPGDTRIVTDGAAGRTAYYVNRQTVTVTVAEGVREDVEIALPEALDRAVTVTIAPLPGSRTAEATGSRHGLGPAESRVAVDVTVSGAPPGGLRLCLPVTTGLRAAARGRTLILLRRGEPVAGSRDEGARVCADEVASFSPFAVGYADTAPEFPEFTMTAMVFTVDDPIAPVTLPLAEDGDGTGHRLLPEPPVLPPGLSFDDGTRVLSGTPTEAFAERRYVWTATDVDGEKDELAFTIEVIPALGLARERLAAVNRSVLPELSRATWGSVLDAVTGRLAGGVSGAGGAPGLAGGLAAVDALLRANAEELKDGRASLRELLDGRGMALRLGASASDAGASDAVLWASGDWRKLSRKQPGLDWSGDLFSAHVGADAALGPRMRGGIAASRFASTVSYTDRSALAVSSAGAAVSGRHRTRLTTATPYVGVYGGAAQAWAALGVGGGRVEIDDAEVARRFGRQSSGARFTAAAVGGSARLSAGGALEVRVKAAGEASRFTVKGNGEEGAIAPLAVSAQRLRLGAEGRRRWALGGGTEVTPVVEAGLRWDGGDGATGAGFEVGAGVAWTDPGARVAAEARARALVAQAGGLREWGASGSVRFSPGPGGRGLSLALSPSWGKAQSGVERLWDEGMAGRASSGDDTMRLDAEVGYGIGFWEGSGVMTPHAGFGYEESGMRRYRLGTRFEFGPDLAVGLQAERKEGAADPEHAVGLDLRLRW